MPSRTFSIQQIEPDSLKELGFVGKTPSSTCAAFPQFSYCLFIPENYFSLRSLPLIVPIHSSDRNNVNLRNKFAGLAERHGCAVLCPLFPRNPADPYDTSENFKVILGQGTRYDAVLLGMIDEISTMYPKIESEAFFLYGFSGGGQFVHRFAYLHPEKLLGLVIGAPGSATMLDNSLDFPGGIKNLGQIFDKEVNLEALKRVPALFAAGDLDKDDSSSLARGRKTGLGMQGRYGNAMRLEEEWRKLGGGKTQFTIVSGAAHEEQKMIPVAERFFDIHLQARREAKNGFE